MSRGAEAAVADGLRARAYALARFGLARFLGAWDAAFADACA